MNYEKEWNFHDLNEKEKAAYLKKEEAYFKEQKKRDDLESAWRKGKISEKEYLNKDRYHADNQQRLLFPNRYKSDEKEVKKMAKINGSKLYIYKNPNKRGKSFANSLKKENSGNLSNTQKAFRSGYLLARKDSATAYKLKKSGLKQSKN